METNGTKPGLTHEKGETAMHREHMKRFDAWLRHPHDGAARESLGDFETHERKALSDGVHASGGYAVPEIIGREIERLEKKFSPVRNLVKVVQAGSPSYKELVNIRGTTAGWVGESGSRSETQTSEFCEVSPTHGELYAYPQASEWVVADAFFNVGQWLAEEVAQQFAVEEGEVVIRGNGSNKPTGMLHNAPTARDDFNSPYRDNEYQYVDGDSDSPFTVTGDGIIATYFKLNSAYRANSTWVLNSSTASFVRQLNDLNGQYLWQQGLTEGQPALLLGRPVVFWEQLDNIDSTGGAAATYPMAIGDWRRAYLLTDIASGLRISVDASITTPGTHKFYVRRREGGFPPELRCREMGSDGRLTSCCRWHSPPSHRR